MLKYHRQWFKNRVSIGALFFFLGFQYATWGTRLPALTDRLKLDPAQVGVLLLTCGLGAALSFPLVTVMMNRWGARKVALAAAALLAGCLPALAWAPGYRISLAVMFFDGLGCALLNSAMNAQGAMLEIRSGENFMSKLHAVFSFGSLLAAIFSSGVLIFTAELSLHFGSAAGALLLLVIGTGKNLFHDDPEASEGKKTGFGFPSRLTLCIGLAMLFGTVTEGFINDWSALYLVEHTGASAKAAPMGIAVFSVMMVISRLFADGWRTHRGDWQVVIRGTLLAGSGLVLALLPYGIFPALCGFACVGLGMGAVTPCIYAIAARQGPATLTLVASMGEIGLLAGPPVIGLISETGSLSGGMGFAALSALLVSFLVIPIRRMSPDEKKAAEL